MLKSGNLRKAKVHIMMDPDLSPMLVRSGWDEIMLDLDGDGVADICLSDESGDGDIDTIAFDATGNGEFNLYLHDSDGNGISDEVYWGDDGAEELELIAFGSEVEEGLVEIGAHIFRLISAEAFLNEEFGVSLHDVAEYLNENLSVLVAEVDAAKADEAK